MAWVSVHENSKVCPFSLCWWTACSFKATSSCETGLFFCLFSASDLESVSACMWVCTGGCVHGGGCAWVRVGVSMLPCVGMCVWSCVHVGVCACVCVWVCAGTCVCDTPACTFLEQHPRHPGFRTRSRERGCVSSPLCLGLFPSHGSFILRLFNVRLYYLPIFKD